MAAVPNSPRGPVVSGMQPRSSDAVPATATTGGTTSSTPARSATSLAAPSRPDSTVVLTQTQIDVLSRVFQSMAEAEGEGAEALSIGVNDVEAAAAHVFQNSLTDEMLDVTIDATEGIERMEFNTFLALFRSLLRCTNMWGKLMTPVEKPVGIETLPTQLQQRAIKRGFEFNLMVVGGAGLGKSTLVDTLFRGDISRASAMGEFERSIKQTVEVQTISHVISESSVRLKLSVTDTPGFGDLVDNTDRWNPVVGYINKQYENYLRAEMGVQRPPVIPDTRIHCCLYFIAPTGHGLKQLDIEFLRRIHHLVNVVPVIAKSDALTLEERAAFKKRIREDLAEYKICFYPPRMEDEEDADIEDADTAGSIRDILPFAVVGSTITKLVDGTAMRGRETKSGFVQVDNPDHCEFTHLRDMLLKTHTHDLQELTARHLYEQYRQRRLTAASRVAQ